MAIILPHIRGRLDTIAYYSNMTGLRIYHFVFFTIILDAPGFREVASSTPIRDSSVNEFLEMIIRVVARLPNANLCVLFVCLFMCLNINLVSPT